MKIIASSAPPTPKPSIRKIGTEPLCKQLSTHVLMTDSWHSLLPAPLLALISSHPSHRAR